MLFNSYVFLFIFLPIVLIGFYTLINYSCNRAVVIWLVISSLFFYGWWNLTYLPIILISVSFNYHLSRFLTHCRGHSYLILAIGIFLNLSLLCYFKYANFLVDNINRVISEDISLAAIMLPLAISFFTFQQIAYLVDCSRENVRKHSFSDYFLFVTFFPQLIAGPIAHHSNLLRQITEKFNRVDKTLIPVGITVFLIGLFKKTTIADSLAYYVDPVFLAVDGGHTPSFFEAWGAALAYSFQLYFDFSGYSDMAIGLGYLFGLTLPLNFYSPYKAVSIIDFWRRWHVTLSRFLRDYLYIPLGGNRVGPLRRYMNLSVVMLLGGLWHGASWNFVLWGSLHGVFLMINHAWKAALDVVFGERRRNIPLCIKRIFVLTGGALTFSCVTVAWVIFRADDMSSAYRFFEGMIGLNGAYLDIRLASILSPLNGFVNFDGYGIGSLSSVWVFIWIFFAALIVWFFPNVQDFTGHVRDRVVEEPYKKGVRIFIKIWRPSFAWATVMALIAAISIFSLSRVSEFLYFQF
jgi:alginate O-acetyltransferase complex protein AlgI